MKNIFTFCLFFCLSLTCLAQQNVYEKLKAIYAQFENRNADSFAKEALSQVYPNADLLNGIFKQQLQRIKDSRKNTYLFLKDLDIRFKTFQSVNLPASLGFSYNYENTWLKNKIKPSSSYYHSLNLAFKGNVAFSKKYNPHDFLESSFDFDGGWMVGGKVREIDSATSLVIQETEDSILALRERGAPYQDLYQRLNDLIQVSDQFFLSVKGKFSFESNQDFTRTQFVPGVVIGFGAKGWNKKGTLRNLNGFDYPFALVRYITGTDATLNVYGVTFPSLLVGLDYVIPGSDDYRKSILGNDNPYKRLKFEIGFKTRVANVTKEVIYLSSNYRWYKELGASDLIRQKRMHRFSFFVVAVESSSGWFVSYTCGRLPFDRVSDHVYAVGFKYELRNLR